MSGARLGTVSPEIFQTACALLNGDLHVPPDQGPGEQKPLREVYLAFELSHHSPGRGQPNPLPSPVDGGRESQDRRILGQLMPVTATRDDVLKLAEYYRERLREAVSPVRGKPFRECAIAADEWPPYGLWAGRWPPNRPHNDWTRLVLADEVGAAAQTLTANFAAALNAIHRSLGEKTVERMLHALLAPEMSVQGACLCLLAAHVLTAFPALPCHIAGEPIRPCLSCTRFFVAAKPNRETCSERCRQRLYRGSQDERGRARLRQQAAEYKRRQRAKNRRRGVRGLARPPRSARGRGDV